MKNKIILKATNYLIILSFISIISCSKGNKNKDFAPLVSVITAHEKNVPLITKLSGRLEANKKAEVRARIAGVIKKRYFKEGEYVKEGQDLYLIDDESAKANYNKAQANFNKLSNDLKRVTPLISSKAISKKEYDATMQGYQAAKSDLENARINLTYAHVSAPISGIIGASLVTEGDLVGQTGSTLLATIQDTRIMKINMYQSAKDVMLLRKAIANGLIKKNDNEPEVSIYFEDNSIYPIKGNLFFVDNTVDENNGQVLLRAEFPNPDNILLPGLFVDVKINQGDLNNVFIIPKQSVNRDEKGNTVIVVNKDGSYTPKPVNIVKDMGNFWAINSGIKNNDLILFEGMAKLILRPKKLNPQIIENPADKLQN